MSYKLQPLISRARRKTRQLTLSTSERRWNVLTLFSFSLWCKKFWKQRMASPSYYSLQNVTWAALSISSNHVIKLFRICGKTTMQFVILQLAWQENGVLKTTLKIGVWKRPDASSTNCVRTSPKSAENRFRVNTFLATMDRACTQIKERFLSMNSVAMTFGILFPSTLLSASDDDLYAAAESLVKQYDTDISSAFPSQLIVILSFVFSFTIVDQVYYFGSCRSIANWLPCTFFHLQWRLYGLHTLADVASDRCNLWAFFLKVETDQKLSSKYYVSVASQWSGGSFDRKPSC